jgi:hypothetical protein
MPTKKKTQAPITTDADRNEKKLTGPYTCGWCQSGSHRGKPKRSSSGKEFPTCSGGICRCFCTTMLDEIQAAIAATVSTPALGSPMPPKAPATPTGNTPAAEAPAPVTIRPATPAPTAPRPVLPEPVTPSRLPNGRRPPGVLEMEIERLLRRWEAGEADLEGDVTPMKVADLLQASSGAVSACWARWERTGMCELGRKPARFVRFLK